MKLVLANNQSKQFTTFHAELQKESAHSLEYQGYDTWLFIFDVDQPSAIEVINTVSQKRLTDYSGVYINGYLPCYELAATMAICCDALHIPFVNRELSSPPSLSKLTSYAKLAASRVRTPRTIAGAQKALLAGKTLLSTLQFPVVVKRADADRGIDNFKARDVDEVITLITDKEPRSLWLVQEFIPNDGFYLVSFYDQQPVFSIFRSLEARPDGNAQKAHMFKPKGGQNARLVDLSDLPESVGATSQRALDAMNRQIGSVDSIYVPATDRTYVLEVNYNPQLVTISTFSDVRRKSFIDGVARIGAKKVKRGGSKPLTTIGRAEEVTFFDHAQTRVIAKVDTGADTSSIWATNIVLDPKTQELAYTLFGPKSHHYTGEIIRVPFGHYRTTIVENSFGVKEPRYVVQLRIGLGGRIVRASFSLADRSPKVYPVLLGRRLLKGKFLVDVSRGTPLVDEEERWRRATHKRLKKAQ